MTEIKICGLVREEDICTVNRYKPDYAGFVLFFGKSKRNLDLDQALILKSLLSPKIQTVAVTVSPTLEQVRQIEEAGFDMIQIHGDLTDEVYQYLSLPILRACNIKNRDSLKAFCEEDAMTADKDKIWGIVLDSAMPGSGKTFDRDLICDKKTDLQKKGRKLFLAGGIDEYNVEEAISRIKPDVIDVSSSVELPDADGRSGGKDPEKVKNMIRKVHNAE